MKQRGGGSCTTNGHHHQSFSVADNKIVNMWPISPLLLQKFSVNIVENKAGRKSSVKYYVNLFFIIKYRFSIISVVIRIIVISSIIFQQSRCQSVSVNIIFAVILFLFFSLLLITIEIILISFPFKFILLTSFTFITFT